VISTLVPRCDQPHRHVGFERTSKLFANHPTLSGVQRIKRLHLSLHFLEWRETDFSVDDVHSPNRCLS
jgi:hypothetical protein